MCPLHLATSSSPFAKHAICSSWQSTRGYTRGFDIYPPNGSSLVDYVIASPELFSLQPTLKVHDLQPESDHCPLTLCTHSNLTVPQDCTKRAPIAQHLLLKNYPERADAFREVLASAMQTSIAHAASNVHGMKGKPCPIKPKPWFDADCMQLRNRLQCMSHRDPRRRQVMCEYKGLLRSKRRQAHHRKHAALPDFAMSNPAAFWQAYHVKKTTCIDIPVEQLAIAFRSCLDPPYTAPISSVPSLKMTSR